jgi:toxin ParE1/3/4
MTPLRFTPDAEADLHALWNYLAPRNPSAARRVLAAIRDRCRLLALHPYAGRERTELDAGLHSFVAGNQVIFYRVAPEEVLIVRVLHGARDLGAIGDWPEN